MPLESFLQFLPTEHYPNLPLPSRYPQLKGLRGTVENNRWHQDDDVFNHTMSVYIYALAALEFSFVPDPSRRQTLIDYFSQPVKSSLTREEVLLLAALFHDIAKPDTLQVKQDGTTTCPNHEAMGANKAAAILSTYGYEQPVIDRVTSIITHHTQPHIILHPDADKEKQRRDLAELRAEIPGIYLDLLIHAMADTQATQLAAKNPSEFNFRIEAYHHLLNSL